MFANIFPESFWPLALVHFLALLSPGPDFMLVLSHSARHRLSGSIGICLGIALGNALYIILAIAGWAGLADSPQTYRVMETAGAVYLLWLGWRLLRSKHPANAPQVARTARVPIIVQLSLGLASALLNPKNMIFYLAIMTALIENRANMAQRMAAGVWMCLVVLSWDLFVAAVISHPAAQRHVWRNVPLIEKACGCLLLFLALSLLVSRL